MSAALAATALIVSSLFSFLSYRASVAVIATEQASLSDARLLTYPVIRFDCGYSVDRARPQAFWILRDSYWSGYDDAKKGLQGHVTSTAVLLSRGYTDLEEPGYLESQTNVTATACVVTNSGQLPASDVRLHFAFNTYSVATAHTQGYTVPDFANNGAFQLTIDGVPRAGHVIFWIVNNLQSRGVTFQATQECSYTLPNQARADCLLPAMADSSQARLFELEPQKIVPEDNRSISDEPITEPH